MFVLQFVINRVSPCPQFKSVSDMHKRPDYQVGSVMTRLPQIVGNLLKVMAKYQLTYETYLQGPPSSCPPNFNIRSDDNAEIILQLVNHGISQFAFPPNTYFLSALPTLLWTWPMHSFFVTSIPSVALTFLILVWLLLSLSP